MMFTAPPIPTEFIHDDQDALRWQSLVVRNGSEAHGGRGLRCARRIDSSLQSGAKNYFQMWPGMTQRFHLSTVPLNGIVFDLGDINPGDPPGGNWTRCRAEANAIALACTRLGIPFLMGLSGGKGVHITLYLPPGGQENAENMAGTCGDCMHPEATHNLGFCTSRGEPDYPSKCTCPKFERVAKPQDWRHAIANRILAEAKIIMWPDEDDRAVGHITHDRLFVAPNEGSNLVTEYGERKSPMAPHRKILWHEGFGPAPPLPTDREAAYLIAEGRGTVRPNGVPVAVLAGRLDTKWVKSLTGKSCPIGPECFESEWIGCQDCPAGD